MDVHDEFLPEEEYALIVEKTPQVCVEVVLRTREGILVAKRTNEPASGEWFWPGARLYKGERLPEAARRVASEEVGVEVELRERLGVYEHFWERSGVEGVSSRHTVNVVFLAEPADEPVDVTLDEQHSEYRFLTEIEPGLHEYVRLYLEDHDLL